MFTVVITEKGGEQRRLDFDKPEVTIGRVQGNDIILPKGNVSKRHSRIVLKDGKFIIVDLKSTNGTYVNGRKITSPLVIKGSDKIYIGDFILNVEDGGAAVSAPPPGATAPPPGATPGPEPARRPPPPLPKRKPQPLDEPDDMEGGAEPSLPDRTAGPSRPPPPAPQRGQAAPMRRPTVRDTLGPDLAGDAGPPMGLGDDLMMSPPQMTQPQPLAEPEEDEPFDEPPAAPPPPVAPPPALVPPPPVAPAPPPRAGRPSQPAVPLAPAPPPRKPAPPAAPRQAAEPDDPRRQKVIELQKEIHDRLIEYLDLRRMDIDKLADEELWEKTENAICDIVDSMNGEGAIPAFVDQDALIKDVLNEALGLGPLEELLADDAVNEIMVNRSDQIYVERDNHLQLSESRFSSDKAVLAVIERIVAPLGRRIDEASPLVDARLKDGSRVNAIIPPLALKGPTLTIRKFRKEAFTGDQLVQMGTLSRGMVEFLQMCVTARKNVIISGGTGSGKTTTLNVVSNFIPEGERILTIEDAAELQLHHQHWVQLESRPPNIEGKGAIVIRDLVRNALRMRPDRIIVGECRGGEALDMLQAMNTGHDGSLTTAHSNGPRDTLSRLETMVLMSGMDLPVRAIREQVAAAIDLVVHQSRFGDGSRRITHITEITGMEGDVITMQDIFTFKQEGFDEQGRVRGRFVPSGFVPRFYEDLQRRGIPVNMGIFRE
jgi:pilus assembly protein CpaF